MGVEIERKFLVDPEKWNKLEKPVGVFFKQGYMIREKDKTIRVRLAGEKGFITIKGATKGFSRKEYEYEIPAEDARELLKNFTDCGTTKTRYCVHEDGNVWEVDVFAHDNEGLIVAELELDDQQDEFTKPDWINREVTEDERYYNANLATHPFKNW